jgi:hypothetical protein
VSIYTHQYSSGIGKKILISRKDESTFISWADKQRIKNELVGEEYTAIEAYPATQNLVNFANVYWLYVLPLEAKSPWNNACSSN